MRKNMRGQKAVLWLSSWAAVGLLLFAACGKDNSVPNPNDTPVDPLPVGVQLASCPSSTTDVVMQNEAFIPASITVPVNTTVKWTNLDVTGSYWIIIGSFESPRVGPGEHICLQFTAPGTFNYHCDPLVTGTVNVQPAAK